MQGSHSDFVIHLNLFFFSKEVTWCHKLLSEISRAGQMTAGHIVLVVTLTLAIVLYK